MAAVVRDGTPTALVTGAATGIGLATARTLVVQEWRVLGTAMNGQDTTDLERAGAEVIDVDLTDPASLEHLIGAVASAARLDALISNAGVAIPGPMEGVSAEELRSQFELNTIAPMLLARGLLPQLRATAGTMIFVGAGQGRVALPFGGPYGASKAALAAFTDALRVETTGSGVDVVLIEPGAVRTGILADSRSRARALLERLPEDLAERYREPFVATLARSEKAFQRALAPDEIGRLTSRILTSRKPKPRYLVGREAVALAFVALLPARWRAALVARLARAKPIE